VARIVPKIELTEVAMKVLLPDMMIHAIDTALENGEVAFDRVRADYHVALFASVDAPLMANGAVLPELFS
jgi:hypothetical protein